MLSWRAVHANISIDPWVSLERQLQFRTSMPRSRAPNVPPEVRGLFFRGPANMQRAFPSVSCHDMMPRNAQSAVQRTFVRIGRGSRNIQPFRQGLFRLGG